MAWTFNTGRIWRRGGDIIDQTLMIEELARYSSAIAISYLLNVCFGAKIIMNMGAAAQKEKYLPKIASGDLTFCLGLTESSSGIDALSLSTRAVKDGDHYIISGQKPTLPEPMWQTALSW